MVLNADYQPLSYFPLSLWGWQDTVRAVFLDRVNIVAEYERRVSSSNFSMKLPSVISLKKYIPLKKRIPFKTDIILTPTSRSLEINTKEDWIKIKDYINKRKN